MDVDLHAVGSGPGNGTRSCNKRFDARDDESAGRNGHDHRWHMRSKNVSVAPCDKRNNDDGEHDTVAEPCDEGEHERSGSGAKRIVEPDKNVMVESEHGNVRKRTSGAEQRCALRERPRVRVVRVSIARYLGNHRDYGVHRELDEQR